MALSHPLLSGPLPHWAQGLGGLPSFGCLGSSGGTDPGWVTATYLAAGSKGMIGGCCRVVS